MRKRDGRESDLDGGKTACESMGILWIHFGGAKSGYFACKMPSKFRSIVESGVGHGSTLPRITRFEIPTYVAMIYLLTSVGVAIRVWLERLWRNNGGWIMAGW